MPSIPNLLISIRWLHQHRAKNSLVKWKRHESTPSSCELESSWVSLAILGHGLRVFRAVEVLGKASNWVIEGSSKLSIGMYPIQSLPVSPPPLTSTFFHSCGNRVSEISPLIIPDFGPYLKTSIAKWPPFELIPLNCLRALLDEAAPVESTKPASKFRRIFFCFWC